MELARHFERVIATDASDEQIKHAVPNPKVIYRVARAEESSLGDAQIDLIAAGQAFHWFDFLMNGADIFLPGPPLRRRSQIRAPRYSKILRANSEGSGEIRACADWFVGLFFCV